MSYFGRVLGLASVSLALPLLFGAAAEKPLPAEDIASLIRQLGSKQFKVRERAERELLQHSEAMPLLRAILNSEDKEVARRAAGIIREMEQREVRGALDRLKARGKSGEIDLLLEQLVVRQDW